MLFAKLLINCHKIFVQSISMKNDLINFNNSLNQNKIVTIYNPINFDVIIDKSNKKNNNNKDILNSNYLLYVGRLEKVKNLELLIFLFKHISASLKEYKLIIIGDGSKKKSINKLINKKKLNNDVVLLGFQDNPYPFISNAKLIISTSLYEGYSSIILESIILNKKIFVSNCPGGNAEIFNLYGKNFLFNLEKMNDIYLTKLSRSILNILKNTEVKNDIKLLKEEILKKHNYINRLMDYERAIDE
jgi:Glycosyltransferase